MFVENDLKDTAESKTTEPLLIQLKFGSRDSLNVTPFWCFVLPLCNFQKLLMTGCSFTSGSLLFSAC